MSYIRENSVVPVLLNQIELYNKSVDEAHRIPAYTMEYKFCEWRSWRADIAWPELHLLLEVEGGTKNAARSRHTTSVGYDEDCVKYSTASILGYRLIRCTGRMVVDGEGLTMLLYSLGLIDRESLAKALPVKTSPYSKAGKEKKLAHARQLRAERTVKKTTTKKVVKTKTQTTKVYSLRQIAEPKKLPDKT